MAPPRFQFNRAYLWPILLASSLVVASGSSELALPDSGMRLPTDKLGHFLVFGLLATLLLRTPPLRAGRWPQLFTTVLIISAFGALDEFRQSFTPGRSVELADWIADTLGASLAVVCYAKWPRYRRFLEWRKRL